MKIVISGGTGFIGTSLVEKLSRGGHTITLLTRNPHAYKPPRSGISVAAWNGRELGDWASHIDGADAVINLAGESIAAKRWSASQKASIRESRVLGTQTIVRAIERVQKRPEVLVSGSAVGYYGDTGDRLISEESQAGSDFLARTCVEWEQEARKADTLGVRVVLLRTGVVLGLGGGALPRLLLPFRLFAGGHLGSGRQWFPWIHKEDVLSIILFALKESKLSGPVNLAAPQQVTMKEFCSTLGKVMKRPSWAPVPAFVLKAVLGEMSIMLLGGQRVVPAGLQRSGFAFAHPDLRQALASLLAK
jgi:uncharacterized protein (TIGR01777 family)